MQKLVFKFGLLATALLLLVKVSQYSMLTHNLSNEIWIGVFALLFLGFGVMISQIYFRPVSYTHLTLPTNREV